jgi:hypothetical protein
VSARDNVGTATVGAAPASALAAASRTCHADSFSARCTSARLTADLMDRRRRDPPQRGARGPQRPQTAPDPVGAIAPAGRCSVPAPRPGPHTSWWNQTDPLPPPAPPARRTPADHAAAGYRLNFFTDTRHSSLTTVARATGFRSRGWRPRTPADSCWIAGGLDRSRAAAAANPSRQRLRRAERDPLCQRASKSRVRTAGCSTW